MKLFSSLNMRGNHILDCPDTEINEQKPTYTEAAKLENISSGETMKVAFGKLKKAISVLITHYAQKATAAILGHVKLSNSAAITTAGEYALDAIEKNASVNGTLANQIGTINGSLTSKDLYDSTNWVSGIANYAKTICRSGDVVFIYVDFYVPDSYSGVYTSYPIITGLPKPNYKHSFLGGISIDGLFTQPMFEIDVDGKLYLQVRGTAVNGRRIFATILYIL